MKKILCIILTTAELCSPVMAGGKGRSYDDREDAYTPPQQRNSRSSRNQNQLQYTPSFNFYASQGPTQGKLSFGGTAAQVAARVMGGIAARNGDRNMMDIADGLGGIGEIASRTNDTRDPWGRFPGHPDYGRKPRNQQNVGPQQQNPGQKRPYQQNNKVQPPVVTPVPEAIPAQNQVNRVPGAIRSQNQPVPQSNVPSITPANNINKEKDNKAQEASERLV